MLTSLQISFGLEWVTSLIIKRNDGWEEHSKRSVQARIQAIKKAVRKLNGCIKQVENMHPSRASSEDIVSI